MFVSHFVCIILPCIPSCRTLNDCVCPEKTIQSVVEKEPGNQCCLELVPVTESINGVVSVLDLPNTVCHPL